MRHGKRYGIDVGKARIGIAESDDEGILATPVATIKPGASDIRKVARLVRDNDAIEVIVGLPLMMRGGEDASTRRARKWARRLAWAIAPVPVRLVDERLSTVSAHDQLDQAGRDAADRRDIIDQAAAVVILQTALDSERLTNMPPGEPVSAADRHISGDTHE